MASVCPGDLALASRVSGPEDLRLLLCYHAQQAAEKALKALLVAKDIDPPRTHDIAFLLQTVSQTVPLPAELMSAMDLTIYAVAARYPSDEEDASAEELAEAISVAKVVVDWAIVFCSRL